MTERKLIQVTAKAHSAAVKLAKIMKDQAGLSKVTITDAASLAIQEALERRQATATAEGQQKATAQ